MRAKDIQRLMYLVGFLDLGAVMLILPLFVVHLRQLGMSPLVGGAVRSIYGVLQLLTSPLLGWYSDRWGRRPVLLLCLAVSVLGYFTLGASYSIFVMMVSRIITGIFKHSTTLCKSVLADVTEVKERPRVLGLFGTSLAVAVILGPALGGNLTEFEDGFSLVCKISSAIFALNFALCFVFLPSELPLHSGASQNPPDNDDITKEDTVTSQQEKPREAQESLRNVVQIMREMDWKLFGDIFLVDFFLTFGTFCYRSSFVLLIDQMFGANPRTIGYIISFQGIIGAVAGLLTGRISKYYNDPQFELYHCSVVQALVFFALTFAPNIASVILLLIPLSISGTIIHTSTSNILIQRSHPSKVGSVTGFGQSIQAMAGMTTPLLSSLAQEVSVYGPGMMASLSAVTGAVLAGFIAHKKKFKKDL
ncbi:hypothetical protein Pmani_024104 [Petrolisthes manimaculis]|uniref:Major facilitator superfamily (MFS) profile domain-containing protein n=1 Tax=Petrolisthes manimaculis TaxID=1843537 RepID=A0AAE1P890_9EUCA|nr:hypothetical protein Pmani_024104 [Petrolisthes manimaculis]